MTDVKKPKQKQAGKDKSQVKLRARKVAAGLLAGKTRKQALLDAGYAPSTAACGRPVVQNPIFQQTYKEILDKAGATDELSGIVIAEAMRAERREFDGEVLDKVPDHNVRLKAVAERHKVLSYYVDRVELEVKPRVSLDSDDDDDDAS